MALTYKKLLKKLLKMTPEQLNMDVTIYDANNDETTTADDYAVTGKERKDDLRPDSDILDKGHPYLLIGLG